MLKKVAKLNQIQIHQDLKKDTFLNAQSPTYLRDELLHEDAMLLAERLKSAKVDLEVHEESSAHHGWQLFPDILPEARRTAERVSRFMSL